MLRCRRQAQRRHDEAVYESLWKERLFKQFCCGEGMPDMSRMKAMMESFGCRVPESAEKE
jgi:hypothetical protein